MSKLKKKPYGKAIFFGVISIGSYIGLFMNKSIVMDFFTRGGLFAALVIATAFYFSFIHGAFASNMLEVVGLQAAKKTK